MKTDKTAPTLVEPTFGERVETWYDRNGNWLNILLIVVLAGIIGYKLFDYMQAKNIAKANMDYGMALNRFQMAQQAQDPQQKNDQLQGAITAAQQVVSDHSDEFVGRQAQLMIGNAQYTIATSDPTNEGVKTLEKARDSYRAYVDQAETNSEKAAGYIALGNVLENLSFIQSDDKVLQEAATAYTEALSASEGTHLGAEAKLSLARIKTAQRLPGTREDAAKLLKEVAENRNTQLISDTEMEATKPVELDGGQTLSVEEVQAIKNLRAWSQKQVAEDALAQIK